MMKSTLSANILGIGLALVLIWFGLSEMLSPQDWAVFLPDFLKSFSFANSLVIIHGAVLTILAVMIAVNWGRRAASALIAFMLAEIVANFIITSGVSDIAVRDFGLFAAALSIAFSENADEGEMSGDGKMTKKAHPGLFPEKYTK